MLRLDRNLPKLGHQVTVRERGVRSGCHRSYWDGQARFFPRRHLATLDDMGPRGRDGAWSQALVLVRAGAWCYPSPALSDDVHPVPPVIFALSCRLQDGNKLT